MDENRSTEPLPVGTRVKILNSGFKEPMKIVEYLGPLGPGGARVYRVRVRRKPPGYTEVSEDQLELLPADGESQPPSREQR